MLNISAQMCKPLRDTDDLYCINRKTVHIQNIQYKYSSKHVMTVRTQTFIMFYNETLKSLILVFNAEKDSCLEASEELN